MPVIRSLMILIAAFVVVQPVLAQQVRTVPQDRTQIQLSYAPVVQKASPSVVNVYATKMTVQRDSMFDDPFFQRFFGEDSPFFERRPRRSQSLGSGVVVQSDGMILTNFHVVDGADDIRVSFADGREYHTELMLADKKTDLAVLRIKDANGRRFDALEFADSDSLLVGDLVLAIGNPFGVGQTVTSGIVSALARTGVGVSDYQFFIQTDAAINPGNSGGALVDMDGKLVGINTAIFSRSGGSNGIGFAIPASMAQFILDAAQNGGELVRPWLGARLQEVTGDIARSIGLSRIRGALVTEIYPNGPAEKAGLREGDLILMLDDRMVEDPEAFDFRLSTKPVGGEANLLVLRRGQEVELVLPLEEVSRDAEIRQITVKGNSRFTGATLVQLNGYYRDELDLPSSVEGVLVLQVQRGSPAQRMGLRPGDVIRALNGERSLTLDRFQELVGEGARGWRLTIQRGNRVINSFISG
ncbi:Do family serine endopeptidase [Maritalea mediterranea]|uniref:Do family serine endopeptidase n=1 Tax=Maritalea mediterranea TaxID=2909667 RepID=A0ABS9EA60_9HYPH|nr:Do family serine endopeptidase [Maritalea mediterranea]MCF4098655.1 Do family serine endopeptidase [Maritalea mediterranea]